MDSRKLVLSIVACLGSSCLHAGGERAEVAVTFFTEPANASLYSPSGGLYGATPLTLYYPRPSRWEDCVPLEPLQAVWASGAESRVELSACPENGDSQHYTFTRPDLPAADLDEWFAGKVDQLALVEAPPGASRDPANAARVETPSRNLVSCNERGPDAAGC